MMRKRAGKQKWFSRTVYGRASRAGRWRSNHELFKLLKGVFGLKAFLTFPNLSSEKQRSFFAQVDTVESTLRDGRKVPIERRMQIYNNLAHNEVEACTHAPASVKRWKAPEPSGSTD